MVIEKEVVVLLTQCLMQYSCLSFFVVVVLFFSLVRQGVTLSPRLECSGTIIAHRSLGLLDSSDHSTSAS